MSGGGVKDRGAVIKAFGTGRGLGRSPIGHTHPRSRRQVLRPLLAASVPRAVLCVRACACVWCFRLAPSFMFLAGSLSSLQAPLADHFAAVNEFCARARAGGGAALVHCFRGKSRSAACVVQLLMRPAAEGGRGLSLRDALRATRAARPAVDINPGFRRALMDLERQLWPGREPSVVLDLRSRRPVLSSAARPSKRAAAPPSYGGGEPSGSDDGEAPRPAFGRDPRQSPAPTPGRYRPKPAVRRRRRLPASS